MACSTTPRASAPATGSSSFATSGPSRQLGLKEQVRWQGAWPGRQPHLESLGVCHARYASPPHPVRWSHLHGLDPCWTVSFAHHPANVLGSSCCLLLFLRNIPCTWVGNLQRCANHCIVLHHGLLSATTAAVQGLAPTCRASLQQCCLAGICTQTSGQSLASTWRCSGESCRSVCRLQAAANRSSWNCLGRTLRQTASGWTGGPFRSPACLSEADTYCAQKGYLLCTARTQCVPGWSDNLDCRQRRCCFWLDGGAVLHPLPLCVALTPDSLCLKSAYG